jgi:hypothetical protein
VSTQKKDVALTLESRFSRSQGRSARTCVAQARVTQEEQRDLLTAARSHGQALSEWAREVLLREARRIDDDPIFTELIATRLLIVNLLKPMLLGKSVPENWIVEAMNGVRAAKHKAAADLRKEYAGRDRKES